MLLSYVETAKSFDASLKGVASEALNAKWQQYMDGFFEAPPGLLADQAMVTLEEIFHSD